MSGLRARLQWDAEAGAVADGPRRYLLMRPDVLMGALARLPTEAQRTWLAAMAEAAREHGGDSLRAYAAGTGHDLAALQAATVSAAADLGWGRWELTRADADTLVLDVQASPFVHGWRAAGGGQAPMPVCAPVRGVFGALAALGFAGRDVEVSECRCAAMQAERGAAADAAGGLGCRFEARAKPGAAR